MEEQKHKEISEQAEPELLYHYTDQQGLDGILSSGEIWATHYRFFNDSPSDNSASMRTTMPFSELHGTTLGLWNLPRLWPRIYGDAVATRYPLILSPFVLRMPKKNMRTRGKTERH